MDYDYEDTPRFWMEQDDLRKIINEDIENANRE